MPWGKGRSVTSMPCLACKSDTWVQKRTWISAAEGCPCPVKLWATWVNLTMRDLTKSACPWLPKRHCVYKPWQHSLCNCELPASPKDPLPISIPIKPQSYWCGYGPHEHPRTACCKSNAKKDCESSLATECKVCGRKLPWNQKLGSPSSWRQFSQRYFCAAWMPTGDHHVMPEGHANFHPPYLSAVNNGVYTLYYL